MPKDTKYVRGVHRPFNINTILILTASLWNVETMKLYSLIYHAGEN